MRHPFIYRVFSLTMIFAVALFLLPGHTQVSLAQPGPSPDDGLAPFQPPSPAEQALRQSKAPKTQAESEYQDMSTMGALAVGLIKPEASAVINATTVHPPTSLLAPQVIGSADLIVHGSGDTAFQSETTIAANTNGSILVAGYNDARGFSYNPISLSGVARSFDGGVNWQEVPVGPGGAGVLPSLPGGAVYGDPDVKFDPVNNRFVFSSIYVRPSDGLQGMSIHLSNATADTWGNPIEVTPTFISGEAADKEFIDVNRNTGRILMTWTQFGMTVRIMSTYSDNGGTTWSPGAVIATAAVGGGVQASIPQFRPGSTNANSSVYAIWRNIAADGSRNIGFARSTDGGATWSAPANITTNYNPEDLIPGIDRVNTSPSLAVDYNNGNIYAVYQANNSTGEGDIAFQRSTNGGTNFSSRILVNSNPGNDRAQFYPAVTVDQSNGRVHVIWYDQDPQATGDLMELMHTFSTDGGLTWSRPTPLIDRPFHAGYGNDTSQPNTGDYNHAIAISGTLHAVGAATAPIVQFDEGQPTSASLFSPDTYYTTLPDSAQVASLRLGAVSFNEILCASGTNGLLDPGETGAFTFALENYVGNPNDSPVSYTNVAATLSSPTAGVTITNATQPYPSIAALSSASNAVPFNVKLSSSFVPGAYVQLMLSVTSNQGSIQLPYLLTTGSPGAFTNLIQEDFESASTPALPAGWTSTAAGTSANVPWVTSTTLPGGAAGTKAAFHSNSSSYSYNLLRSPVVSIPAPGVGAVPYVTLDFDVAYNTEFDTAFDYLAYDGMTLRIFDQTPGQLGRSVLAEAFAEILTTGSANHFPKHLPRDNNSSYFQDMSVWAGNSNGLVHVSMKFPGTGLAGRQIQLRFEYTDDGSFNCLDVGGSAPCGVAVDNVVFKSVVPTNGACNPIGQPTVDLSLTKSTSSPQAKVGEHVSYRISFTNAGPSTATGVVIQDTIPAGLANPSYISSGPVITPTGVVSYTWQVASMAPSASGVITVTGTLASLPLGTVITNTATITGAVNDQNSANNTSSAQITVVNKLWFAPIFH